MLIIKIENKAMWLFIALLVLLTLCGGYYVKQSMNRKPIACLGDLKIRDGEGNNAIRKDYSFNFYLNGKNRALVFINGIYVGHDNIPRTLRRTLSFDSFWSANRLVVHNVIMEKNRTDDAPDDAFSVMGENDVIEFEMLTRDAYLITTARAKIACNIH